MLIRALKYQVLKPLKSKASFGNKCTFKYPVLKYRKQGMVAKIEQFYVILRSGTVPLKPHWYFLDAGNTLTYYPLLVWAARLIEQNPLV